MKEKTAKKTLADAEGYEFDKSKYIVMDFGV